jgi:plasmid stability protein
VTAGRGDPGQEPELDGYGQVISRARSAVPGLSTEALVRIRAVLEQALAGERPGAEALEALAAALDGDG